MEESEASIDLQYYFGVIRRRKWQILRLTLMIVVLGILVVYRMTSVYEGVAALIIEMQPTKVVSIEDVYGYGGANRGYYQTQLEILKSRPLSERVFDQLRLLTHPEYQADSRQGEGIGLISSLRTWIPSSWLPDERPATSEVQRRRAVDRFAEKIEVKLLPNSQIAYISFLSTDPELAMSVPNAIAEAYIDADLRERLEATRKAGAWLNERLEVLKKTLDSSEKNLQDYLRAHDLVDVGFEGDVSGVKTIAAAQISALTASLVEARGRLSAASSAFQQVSSVRGGAYDSIPAVLNSPLVQRQKEIELGAQSKLTQLSEQFGEKHPAYIAARSEFAAAKANTARQVNMVIDGIKKDYEIAKSTVESIERSLKDAEQKVQEISASDPQIEVLRRDVEGNRALYDMFMTRLKETDVSQTNTFTVGRVVNPAVKPDRPAKPNKGLIILITFGIGLVLSSILAFALEYLDNTIKTPQDVPDRLGLPALGVLPWVKNQRSNKTKGNQQLIEDERSPYAEAIRSIRTGILLSGLDKSHRVVVVTSSMPGEGKTTFSINQAVAFGKLGKTLLIEADLRRPRIAGLLNIEGATQGLSDLVAGAAGPGTVRTIDDLKIDVLLAGTIPPNPLELLSSKRFDKLLAALEERYEHIIIDCPPVVPVSDPLVLSRHASAVIYIVLADHTPYQLAQEGLARLRQANAPILGVILNKLDIERTVQYSYYGHQRYSSYGYS